MELLLFAFLAGILTVLAPCVLPLLPIIIGGSVTGKSWRRPALITVSLAVSLLIFTFLLKVSTVFIGVPQSFWKYVSGGIILFFGIITLFPHLWESISSFFRFGTASQGMFQLAKKQEGVWGTIALGAALGPVFSSCSPTFSLILAVVLPASFLKGFVALSFYILGLSLVLFGIAYFGQRLVSKLKWVAHPKGVFKKILGVLFILVGLSVMMGLDKRLEAALVNGNFFDVTRIETEYFLEE